MSRATHKKCHWISQIPKVFVLPPESSHGSIPVVSSSATIGSVFHCPWTHPTILVKATQQAQNGVTYAKPHITKPRLNYTFSSPRNRNLKQHQLGTLPDKPLPSFFCKVTLQLACFLRSITSSSLLPSAYTSLSLQRLRASFYLLDCMLLPNVWTAG